VIPEDRKFIEEVKARVDKAQLEPHAPDEWWADLPRLIQMVEERDAEIERLSEQIVRVIHDNELIIEMGEVDEAKIQALQAEVESLRVSAHNSPYTRSVVLYCSIHLVPSDLKAILLNLFAWVV